MKMNIIFISTIKIVAHLHKYSNNKIKKDCKNYKFLQSLNIYMLFISR